MTLGTRVASFVLTDAQKRSAFWDLYLKSEAYTKLKATCPVDKNGERVMQLFGLCSIFFVRLHGILLLADRQIAPWRQGAKSPERQLRCRLWCREDEARSSRNILRFVWP
jgi:hypothetical protein